LASLERGRVPIPRPVAPKEAPLVDRTEEMNVLKEAVYKAVQGEGCLILVHGEAGIGKTRLLREVGAYAQSCGVQVLHGRCPALFRMDGVPPYIIWKEVIKDYLGACTPEQLHRVIGFYPAEVAKLVPELSQKLRMIPQSIPISPEQEQNRLFEAVSQFITNVSQETPLLVILDDLQWTDPSSLLLLHYLARGMHKTPLLLLCAYRSTEVDDRHPLTPVLAELNRERLPQEIQLKRMSLSDVSELIKNILEQEDVPKEFCKLVYDKTRGNPFFAEEVVKSLKEEGIICREKSEWKFKEVSVIEFPKSVRNVVKARISRLDQECQNVLTMASFVGNEFGFDALREVTGLGEGKLLELIDGLFKTGLIKEQAIHGKRSCSFADILVRDVVYEEVSPLKRTKLHEIVGATLEKIYAKSIDEHLGELAVHFLEGGDEDKALDYFTRAGEKAQKIYANNEAASYYQSSLRILAEKGDEIREEGHVLERLGDVEKLVGDYDASMKSWTQALPLFEQFDEKETVARLHRKMANVLWSSQGDAGKARMHHEEALNILEKKPESAELASLFDDMSRFYFRTEDVPKARSWAEKALGLAKKLNAQEIIASSYSNLADALSLAEDMNRAAEYHEKALKIALDNGYVETAIRAYSSLSTLAPSLEVIGSAVNEKSFGLLEKAYELAKKAGDVHWVSFIGSALSDAYWGMGDMKRAILLAEESVALARKTGNIIDLSHSLNLLGQNYWITGEWDQGERLHEEALTLAQKAKDQQQIMMSHLFFATLYFWKSDGAKGKEHSEKAIEVAQKTGARSLEYWSKCVLVSSLVQLGELEKAKNLVDDVLEFALETKDTLLIAMSEFHIGTLFRDQKKWKESIESFEKSRQQFEALDARRFIAPWFSRFLYEYALMYVERDQEGDREKARDLLNQVLEMFQKMGAEKDIEKAEARIAFTETGKAVPKPKPAEPVSTGNADLDRLLYGGIASNSAVVLTSPSCSEKDQLMKSFLETGAKKGEAAFYVTINPASAKALADEYQSIFYLFICNPEADAIIKDSHNIFKMKGVENLTSISIALASAIKQLDPSLKSPRRICLSLISDILLQHHAVETRRWLTALITKLKSEDFTTLAVIDPQVHPSEELHAILGLFDGEINIFEKETEKGSGRYLKIKRMSDQKYLENEIPLTARA